MLYGIKADLAELEHVERVFVVYKLVNYARKMKSSDRFSTYTKGNDSYNCGKYR